MRKPEKQKKQRERIYAALLCICTMLSLVSVPVLAAEMRKGAGSHEHTRECYTWMEKCVHEHTPECYPQEEIRDLQPPHLTRWRPPSAAMYAVRKAAASRKN